MSDGNLPLKTERLTLRVHREGDDAWMLPIYARPEVARYIPFEPWTAEEAAAQLAKRLTRTGLESESDALALVIEHEGEPIGEIGFWLTDKPHWVAEIGWVLDPAHGGRGFASEAVRAVLDFAFDRYPLHRVHARVDARNEASAALARRVGMTQEACLREDEWFKGEWSTTLIFGMLASDRAEV
ncbi:MAG: GNAT family protein [Microbacterium sp.]